MNGDGLDQGKPVYLQYIYPAYPYFVSMVKDWTDWHFRVLCVCICMRVGEPFS